MVDRRKRAARRHAELVRAFTVDINSDGALTTAQASLVRQAALIALRYEQLEQQILDGATTDDLDDTLVRLANAQTRVLKSLGIERRKAKSKSQLDQYLPGKP